MIIYQIEETSLGFHTEMGGYTKFWGYNYDYYSSNFTGYSSNSIWDIRSIRKTFKHIKRK